MIVVTLPATLMTMPKTFLIFIKFNKSLSKLIQFTPDILVDERIIIMKYTYLIIETTTHNITESKYFKGCILN